ncbi:MAG TPA: glycosyl hydrolase family 65 protein [Kineosporiaceae bacterium]
MSTLDRTMDAVVLDVEAAVTLADPPALRRRIERLLTAGVDVALVTARPLEELNGLAAPWPHGPGRLGAWHDPGAGRGYGTVVDELAARGVHPDGVALVVGDVGSARQALGGRGEVVPASRTDLLGLLDDQLWRRAGLRIPAVSDDPGWSVVEPVPAGAGARPPDVLFTIGDGAFATRGGLEEAPGAAIVLGSGVWSGEGTGQHLLPGPQWTQLDFTTPTEGGRRMLDLRAGALVREDGAPPAPAALGPAATSSWSPAPPLRTLRFVSAARPGLHVLRAEGPATRFAAGRALFVPGASADLASSGPSVETGRDGLVEWARVAGAGCWMVAAAVQTQVDHAGHRTVQRLVAYRAGRDGDAALAEAAAAVREAQLAGFERLLAEHRRVWQQRWADADVGLPDDPATQLGLRFALFQLWVNAGRSEGSPLGDEQAVGARGLSGPGYAGHVFWDADVFVLPAVATICPPAARAILQYRIRRLPQARELAAASGRAGARFPWESARDGDEVTPTSIMLGTLVVPVLTGEHEEHITADIAWAADRYTVWTGDRSMLDGPGRALVLETARYWASRVEAGPDGRVHITGVIGPDEYHENVDDNVFTNVMARWNLLRAAALVEEAPPTSPVHEEVQPGEPRRWRDTAAALVDGYDPLSGRHEQFAGYLGLEPLVAAEVAAPPFAADLALGPERTHATQLIKQPDVLMAHFLVPEAMPAESLEPDLDLYVPHTSHGSSLSPAITAALLARAGRADEALAMYRLAVRLDLDNITGSAAKGLHLATLGGAWQALLAGFLGLAVADDGVLTVAPHLPSDWSQVTVRLLVRGVRVRVRVTASQIQVTTDRALRLATGGYPALEIQGTVTFDRR